MNKIAKDASAAAPEPINFVTLTAVTKMVSLSRVGIWNLRQRGAFPEPVKLSGRRSAYVLSEVQAWMRDRIASRDASSAKLPANT